MLRTIRLTTKRREQLLPKQRQKYSGDGESFEKGEFRKSETLIFTCRYDCWKLSKSNGIIVKERITYLSTDHEEAYYKMFLCAKHTQADEDAELYIHTVDSDVLLLALYYQLPLSIKILVQLGSGSKKHILDVNATTLSESKQSQACVILFLLLSEDLMLLTKCDALFLSM